MSPQAVRPLALTAMLGGTLYVIAGLVQLTSPEQSDPFSRMFDYLIEVPLALSLLLTLAGFVALYLLLRAGGYRGLRGSTGFRAAVLGQGAMLASTVASLIAGAAALGFLYFAGTLVLLVGLALLSVATHRAALLPGWSPYLGGRSRRGRPWRVRNGRGRCGPDHAGVRTSVAEGRGATRTSRVV